MNNEPKTGAELTLAQRKELLIRQGANYRAGVHVSVALIGKNLQTDTLARSIVSQVTGTAYAAVGNLLRVKSANLQTLVPIVLSGISFAMKAKLLRPLLRTSAIAGGVGLVAYVLLFRKRKTPRETGNDLPV